MPLKDWYFPLLSFTSSDFIFIIVIDMELRAQHGCSLWCILFYSLFVPLGVASLTSGEPLLAVCSGRFCQISLGRLRRDVPFQNWCSSILFLFPALCSMLFDSIRVCSVLFYTILYSTLFYLFGSILFYSNVFYSILF